MQLVKSHVLHGTSHGTDVTGMLRFDEDDANGHVRAESEGVEVIRLAIANDYRAIAAIA